MNKKDGRGKTTNENCKQNIRLTFTVDLKLHKVVSKIHDRHTTHMLYLISTYVRLNLNDNMYKRTRTNWHIEFIRVSCLFTAPISGGTSYGIIVHM